ncbi:MAG: signal transduction histidine kinase [Bacteroidetes bacterium]|jgi:two-component sensor histidine kinase|nr:signal transduction histidine kinase [Bacteroidota bacterium]
MKHFLYGFILLFLMCQQAKAQVSLYKILQGKTDGEKLDYLVRLPARDKVSEQEFILKVLENIKAKAEKENNFYSLTKIEIIKGSLDYSIKRYDKAIPAFNDLLDNSKLLTTDDSVYVLFFLKNSYVCIRNAAKALEIHKSLLAIHKRGKIKDNNMLNPPLSVIYMQMELFEEAIRELKQEFRLRQESGAVTQLELAQFYNNVGVYYNRNEKYDSAYANFVRAGEIVKKGLLNAHKNDDNMQFFNALIDGNLGSVLTKQRKYKEAIPLIKRDIFWSLNTMNIESAANAYCGVAECYCRLGQHDRARKAIDSAFVLYKGINSSSLLNAHKINGEVYQAAKNYKMAAEEFAYYIRRKDSVTQADRQIQMVNDQVAFELDEKESQLKQQKLKIEEGQRALDNNKSDQIIMLIAIFATALISLILFVAYRNSTKKQRELEIKNEEISTKNTVIEHSLHEKEALIKEVHHRVKNNLQIISSLLRLQSSKQGDEHVQNMFDDSVKRIQSMALVHELLYKNKNLVSIPIHTYIQNLAEGLSVSYGLSNQISITVHSDAVQLDIDTTIPLGLIINELVTNSIKHAFDEKGGRVDVLFILKDGKHKLIVRDNGKGLPANFATLKETSLGMELVEALSEQIGACYTYSSENGSKFEFEF